MAVDQSKASIDIQCVSNVEPGDAEGSIVNLHPSFPIPKEQLHQDCVFPWLKHVQEVGKAQIKAFGDPFKARSLGEMQEHAERIQPTLDAWHVLRKAWSLHRNGRSDLAAGELTRFTTRGYDGPPEVPHALYHFSAVMLNPALIPVYTAAAETTSRIRDSAPGEFDRFRDFYLATWRAAHDARYFDIFREYFSNFHEVSQTLLHCQYDLPLPHDAAASSTAFGDTKMLYGNLFEVMTSHCVVLACLNNVMRARPFDDFETMRLEKYLTTAKSKRADCFRDNRPFSLLVQFLDNKLRNASHHGAITIDQRTSKVTFGGDQYGASQKISYAEYLYRCNQVFLRLCALLMLELLIVGP